MKKKTVTLVIFYSYKKKSKNKSRLRFEVLPGFPSDLVEVTNEQEAHKMAVELRDCYEYDLWRREDEVSDDGKVRHQGTPQRYKVVVLGRIYTYEEVKSLDIDELIYAMENLRQDKFVRTRCDTWFPLIDEENVEYKPAKLESSETT